MQTAKLFTKGGKTMTTESTPKHDRSPSAMTKIKIALAVLLGILVLIIVFQNIETVTTRILWLEIPMPLALLQLLMLAIGFAGGVLATGAAYRKRSKH
jgi:uncharacterized integral membrane protein